MLRGCVLCVGPLARRFVAYNLRLEASFLFDEGATVSQLPLGLFARSTQRIMTALVRYHPWSGLLLRCWCGC